MTAPSPTPGDPQDRPQPVDDSDWVRSVVSAALVHANIPEEQAGRVLSAATSTPSREPVVSEGVAPFSSPAKPQAEDWPDLAAPMSVDATKARLESERTAPETYRADIDGVGALTNADPVVAVPPSSTLLEEPALSEPSTLPALSSDAGDVDRTTLSDGSPLNDVVMVETDASVEGYRQSDMRTIIEWLVVIFLALVVAVLAKEFIVQAFWIPSPSMETTVNVGDRVLVNKVTYEVNDVRRGDLVVFEKIEGTPGNTDDLIKRAIALPGETIELRSDGQLWIWGPGETPDDALLLDEPYLDVQNELLNPPAATDAPSETIWHENCVSDSSAQARCTLDDSSYFMMGDNRRNSSDSRAFGPVPEENLIGRAFFRIWPLGAISTL